MQTIHFFKCTIIGAVAILLASCANTNQEGKLIPKEAAVVIKIDGKSLTAKLPWSEIKQNPLFVEMSSDSSLPATLKSLLDNPDNAGVNTQAALLFFIIKDSVGSYIAFEGNVKDETAFKAFNQKMTENGAESEKDGVQFISKSPVCVGFTKEKFVYIFDTPQFSEMDELTQRMKRDSIRINPVSGRDIGATCKAIFALKESNSLAGNEKFTGLMKATGDVHFWMNSEEISKGAASTGALAMVNLDKFSKGNITTATLNFENGKMLLNAKTYASEEMISLFKKYSGGKVNEDMIRRMPGKDIIAVMALNFKPEALRDLVKMTGLDGLINLGVQKLGFNLDDFIKANKGDILVGISDLTLTPDSTNLKFKAPEENISISQKPSFNFIFAASIGEKESMNKLIEAGKKIGQQQLMDSSKPALAFNSNNTYFAIGNKAAIVDQYLATSGPGADFISKITGEPFGGYLNIQTLLKSMENELNKDSAAKISYDASISMWDNILWKGGNYRDGGIEQTAEINLVDKTTNSLKQLNQYAGKLSELYKEQKRKKKASMMAYDNFRLLEDSISAPLVKTK